MRWRLLLLVGLPAFFVGSSAFAQIPEEGVRLYESRPPAVNLPAAEDREPTYFSENVLAPDTAVSTEPVLESLEPEPEVEASRPDPIDGFLGYRYELGSTDWIIGTRDQFGMFSFTWDHYQEPGVNHGVGLGFQFHLLSGPVQTDMPPRLYDFSIAYQHRDQLGIFSYDVAAAVMASSDFEGDSHEGIRFPGHAVGFLSVGPKTDLVFGIDYLDRGDVKLLPVGGLIVVPHPDVRLEVVFPRPRAVVRLTDRHQLYLSGELGGSTWAIERAATMVDDLATYRDLRLCVGLQTIDDNGNLSAIEIGYLFDRRLEYTSGNGNFSPNDTAMIRLVRTF